MKEFLFLVDWLKKSNNSGVAIETLIKDCIKTGWSYETSIQAVELALNTKIKRNIIPQLISPNKRTIDVGDREVEILMRVTHPNIFYLKNMLSSEECDLLIELAEQKLLRSTVTESMDGERFESNQRTSQTARLLPVKEDDLVSIINKRLAKFLLWPIDRMEHIQVQRYGIGHEYQAHYDYFPEQLDQIESRVATILVYLNEPEKGGETLFSDIGLNIVPQKGAAVFFSYDRSCPSTLTKHAGCPVLKGEKWILTKFIRNLV